MVSRPIDLTYQKNYVPIDRQALMEKIRSQMSLKRFNHVLGVETAAVELAEKYNVSVEAASIAALVHDYAKEREDKEMHDLIISENLDLELLQYGSSIWHGPVGAVLAKKELGIENEQILNAIRHHTVGAAEMSLLEQIIYVADYIEDGREFPEVEKARKLAASDLSAAVAFETQQTLNHLIKEKRKIYPKIIDTYNAWVVKPEEAKNGSTK